MLFIAYRQATSAPRVPMIEKESCFHATGTYKGCCKQQQKNSKGQTRVGLYSRLFLNLENTIKNKVVLVDILKMAIKIRLNNNLLELSGLNVS